MSASHNSNTHNHALSTYPWPKLYVIGKYRIGKMMEMAFMMPAVVAVVDDPPVSAAHRQSKQSVLTCEH